MTTTEVRGELFAYTTQSVAARVLGISGTRLNPRTFTDEINRMDLVNLLESISRKKLVSINQEARTSMGLPRGVFDEFKEGASLQVLGDLPRFTAFAILAYPYKFVNFSETQVRYFFDLAISDTMDSAMEKYEFFERERAYKPNLDIGSRSYLERYETWVRFRDILRQPAQSIPRVETR